MRGGRRLSRRLRLRRQFSRGGTGTNRSLLVVGTSANGRRPAILLLLPRRAPHTLPRRTWRARRSGVEAIPRARSARRESLSGRKPVGRRRVRHAIETLTRRHGAATSPLSGTRGVRVKLILLKGAGAEAWCARSSRCTRSAGSARAARSSWRLMVVGSRGGLATRTLMSLQE